MPHPVAPWWELTLEVPVAWADDAAAVLVDEGAAGVEIRTPDMIAPPALSRPPAAAPMAEHDHRRPLRAEHALLIASYVDGEPDALQFAAQQTLSALAPELATTAVKVTRREDNDWTEQWKAFFVPIPLGRRTLVRPPWETSPITGRDLELIIDPGLAFGTGHHPTTALCLELMEETLERTRPASLLDIGTGSAILAILAAKLGVQKVVGIDIDEAAVRAARDNLGLNHIAPGHIDLSDTPLAEIEGPFDAVVANIIAPVLIDQADPILSRVASGGSLWLSGLTHDQADDVLDAYRSAARDAGRPAPIETARGRRDEWVALQLTLPTG